MAEDKDKHIVVPVAAAGHKGVPMEKSPAEDEFLNLRSKQIPRFPSNLCRIGRERDCIAPRTVAIGPYYHGVPQLQPMEEVKRTVVNYFFHGLAQSREAIYEEIKSIALNVRCLYTDEDALEGISDDRFAEIMFIDGCFLLQFIDTMLGRSGGVALRSIVNPHTDGVFRDMMLFENQIPWAVMEVLMLVKSLKMEHIILLLVGPLHGLFQAEKLVVGIINKDYKPSHLLCLIRFFEAASSKSAPRPLPSVKAVPVCTSAVELAEIGIKLEASREMQFSAMGIVKGPCCAKLVLAPLQLGAAIYCWLVNMAAFEMWAETSWDECSINSYLMVLSLLMNREEDVRELRIKHIVHGTLSDRQTLDFFNDLATNLSDGSAYWQLMVNLEEYKRKRWMWIAIYRFVYKHAKIIAAVLSIVGVLVGIFKALLSLKKPPAHF